MRDDASFLDTSGWMALLNTDDRLHASAVAAWREIARRRGTVVVTDWIIAETGNGLARTGLRDAFARAVRLLPSSTEFRLILIDDDLLMRAVELYQARPDKTWGLVDCSSFVVMTQEGIREAITGDHHFEQAGFRRLLSDPDTKGGVSNGPVR
jgi:predicted nucleic acid-binding protein